MAVSSGCPLLCAELLCFGRSGHSLSVVHLGRNVPESPSGGIAAPQRKLLLWSHDGGEPWNTNVPVLSAMSLGTAACPRLQAARLGPSARRPVTCLWRVRDQQGGAEAERSREPSGCQGVEWVYWILFVMSPGTCRLWARVLSCKGRAHRLTQFHFLSWYDQGVPSSTRSLLGQSSPQEPVSWGRSPRELCARGTSSARCGAQRLTRLSVRRWCGRAAAWSSSC